MYSRSSLGSAPRSTRSSGRPQDIEWAYADDHVWLLQARPMTALPPRPIQLNRLQRRLGSILLDNVPVRPYPIDMSTWVPYGPTGMMTSVVGRFGLRDAFEGFVSEDEYGWSIVSLRIVAREYGIPAIMGTGSGTSVLTEGQLVTVDGSTGRVTVAATEMSPDDPGYRDISRVSAAITHLAGRLRASA
jgi:hypothetical protein